MKVYAGNIETDKGFFDFNISNNEIIVSNRVGEQLSKVNLGSLNVSNNNQIDFFLRMYKNQLKIDGVIKKIGMIPEKFRFNNQQTTDMFVFYKENNEIGIVMGKRKYPPFGYALFGGMVEKDETFKSNSKKELEEESGLSQSDIIRMESIGTFNCSEIRGTLTTNLNVVEISLSKKEEIQKKEKDYDDIIELIFISKNELETLINTNQVVPHHVELIEKAIQYIEK